MATINKVNGVAASVVSEVDGVASASIASINGVTWIGAGGGFSYNDVLNNSIVLEYITDAYMHQTYTSESANRDNFTVSLWIKRGELGRTNPRLWSAYAAGANRTSMFFDSSNRINFINIVSSSVETNLITTAKVTDTSSWYHICFAFDSTDATPADRNKLWVNGVRITAFDTEVNAALNEETSMGDDVWHSIGRFEESDAYVYDGYIADFYFIDDSAQPASEFGEFNAGIWIPKAYAGALNGTNTSHLNFEDDADLGADVSGKNNDWTLNSITSDHQTTDTPENQYCVHDQNNWSNAGHYIAYGGKRIVQNSATWMNVGGTFLLESGKWYWEVDTGIEDYYISMGVVGIDGMNAAGGDALLTGATGWGWLAGDGAYMSRTTPLRYQKLSNASAADFSDLISVGNNHVMQCAFDADTGKIWFGVNDTWFESGDPGAGTDPIFTYAGTAGMIPIQSANDSNTGIANFGERTFAHTPPTGFLAICSDNISAVGSFNTYSGCSTEDEDREMTYIGNGITNGPYIYLGFAPADICIDGTHYDKTDTGVVQFTSNGFKLISTTKNVNNVTYTYEAWGDKDFKYANAVFI